MENIDNLIEEITGTVIQDDYTNRVNSLRASFNPTAIGNQETGWDDTDWDTFENSADWDNAADQAAADEAGGK